MTAYVFPVACVAACVGAILYGADAWLYGTVGAMAALCWITRHDTYDGLVRLVCAVGLSGGAFALVVSAVAVAADGMVELAVISFACGIMSGVVASTQVGPAGRFISDAARFVKNRTA